MSPLSISHKIYAIVGIIFLAGGFLMNSSRHAEPVTDVAATLPAAILDGEVGARMREMSALASLNFIGKDWAKSERARLMAKLGKAEMNNFSVIRTENNRLYRGSLLPIYTANAEKLAKCLAWFSERASGENTRVFFLVAPERVAKEDYEEYGGYPVVNVHPAIDSLLYILQSRDILFLDSRYKFRAEGVPAEDITIATGTQMTGAGAFQLFSYLLDELEREEDIALDPGGYFRDPANYAFKTYPDFFIGSYGKETGPAFSGFDDLETITPAFETEFAIEGLNMFGESFAATGTADETLLDPQRLTRTGHYYHFYPENYYRHASLTWSVVRNLRNPEGKKILFIHDFYTAQLAGFLAYASSEMHTLALWGNQEYSAEEYIKGQSFDCVIISLFPSNILEERVQKLILNTIPEEIEEEEKLVQTFDDFAF